MCSKTNSQASSIAPSLKYWPNEKLPSISKKVRCEPARPTSSMSSVRKLFCTVVSSGAGGCSRPRKNGISGCMPAVVSSVERSSARGIRGADGRKTWPLDSKYARYPARSSAELCMGSMLLPGYENARVPADADRLAEGRDPYERGQSVPARREPAHRLVVHRHPAPRISAFDGREVAEQDLFAVVAPEVEPADARRTLCEVPQLLQVVDAVRHGDQQAAGLQDARELGEPAVEVGNVVEHPRCQGDVELAVRERELLDVAHSRVDALRTLFGDHRLRLVDTDDLDPELVLDPRGELPLTAADLEHPTGLRGGDGLEGVLARIVAFGVDVGRLAGAEVVGCRVLLADERRLVGAHLRAAFGSASSSATISSRIFSSERRISRETCICEIPTCCAIWDCVNPSKKRRWRILRSRSSRTRKPGASTARSSETSYWCSSVPIDSSGSSSSPSSVPPPDESESDEYARPDSSASSTSSSSVPAAFASSLIVGDRLSCTVSCSTSRDSCTFSSCRPRGTRTDQPLSRKWRLISPMMFGVAYVVSSTPRLRSKRSIALINPIAPIWTRSSSCSPRYE